VEAIESVGLKTSRFKTGTPPRVDGRTVDLASLRVQHGDSDPFWFSFYERASHPAQLPCYLTYTGPRLKEIIQEHLGESALYGGEISGRGPRYCPSIEDKIVKFPRAERHQVFLEPEGLETTEMYVNGLSTSLPVPVQLEFLRTVPGLEYVRMTRPGYAIEYDYFPPQQLEPTLESKVIRGIFFAGQVNGTTGYEEAAGQGALAGINAAGLALGHEQIQLSRGESYIGVLVDDLISRGVDEPYRLFTSRSEYRLLLRQDNALRRLYPLIRRLNLLGRDEEGLAEQQMRSEEEILEYARTTTISRSAANEVLARFGSADVSEPIRIADLARRPGVSLSVLLTAAGAPLDPANADWAEIELKYAGYLQRERASAEKLNQMEDFSLPENFDYTRVQSISYEAREKLQRQQPRSLGQASRIPGVSPCDLQNLIGAVLRVRAPSPGSFM
jgi:tRNA uridine 5-carboxymethylaminomethyl modification enzyme